MAGDMPQQELERMLELLGDIPPMPAVATKILRVASSEFARVNDVTRLIAVDQGLASKILSTCNSPYYGLPQRVKTLSRAVALLGFKAVRNLVLVHSLPWKRAGAPTFSDSVIRVHAAATAMAARVIATRQSEIDPEEALLGGLMHDAGRLALNFLIPEKHEPVLKAIYIRRGGSVELERQYLGIDHTRAGEYVLEKWTFPEELVVVARNHHDPPETLDPMTLVVRAADEMAKMMGHGVQKPEEPPTEVPPALAQLGVAFGDLAPLEEQVGAAIDQGRELFGLG